MFVRCLKPNHKKVHDGPVLRDVSHNFSPLEEGLLHPTCPAPWVIVRSVIWVPQQEPGLFEPDIMMAQLRYSGVLETVRIRKEGFPVRLPFQMFIDRYFCQSGFCIPQIHFPIVLGVHSSGSTGLTPCSSLECTLHKTCSTHGHVIGRCAICHITDI